MYSTQGFTELFPFCRLATEIYVLEVDERRLAAQFVYPLEQKYGDKNERWCLQGKVTMSAKKVMNPEIVWTCPRLPSHNVMFMLEPFTFKASVRLAENMQTRVTPLEKLVAVQAWTNVYHRENPQGDWHAINLEYLGRDSEKQDCLVFGNSVMVTSHGYYSTTFRAKTRSNTNVTGAESDWIWAGHFQQDGVMEVRLPTQDRWTQGPDFTHIIGNVYLGNFIAATKADELDFDAVLNVADNLDLIPGKFKRPVVYHKIPMADGAHNPIPSQFIQEAVQWIRSHDIENHKTLVNCRAGIGRAGSAVVAYVFAFNPSFSFDDAYQFVFKKRFVYPHKDLYDTAVKLFR